MWSKQADTRAANKNMTSFKNKITNRKRKNSAAPVTEPGDAVVPLTDPKQNEDKSKQTKSAGKNRNRNRSKKDVGSAAADKVNSARVAKDARDVTVAVSVDEDLENADVVLRNAPQDATVRNNNAIKRYSDSFVIENNGHAVNTQLKIEEAAKQPPALTRAVSGFFIIDQARKARRFSDLFRPNSMKLSNSVENLKMNNEKNSIHLEKNNKQTNQDKKSTFDKKQIKLEEARIKQIKKSEKLNPVIAKKEIPTKESVPSTENSYLRRVKSKIYKTKADTQAAKEEADSKSKKYKPKKNHAINGSRIPEDEVAVLTPNGVRKSITHFDFRLIRQTSNLERGRPKILTQSSVDETDTTAKSEKPVLTKAKSSSSINLNMLRTRRNKLMEQVFGTKDVHNEFEFIAFGSVNNVAGLGKSENVFGSQRSLQKQPSWLHIHAEEKEEKDEKAEGKQGQPVSRSGSDRRPDAVKEENSSKNHHHHQDSSTASTVASNAADAYHHDLPGATPEKKQENTSELTSSTILPATGSSRRVNSNINRSESVKEQSEKRKQRRNISDPSHNTTSGNVDLDHHTALSNTDSGSSSNSSISCNGRLSESPSNSVDVVGQSAALRANIDSDSDMEVEAEPWQNLVPPEELRNLPACEKKRQEIINELFHTEGSHVRNLKTLYKIFHKKIQESQTLKPDELTLLFPNIKEMLDIHTEINKEMRRRRREDPIVKELGTMLLDIFDCTRGEQLKKAAATFCESQQLALEFIKKRREKDPKFDAVLVECEKKRQCRRLPLQGILPTEMQRLSKYPLLLERLIDSLESIKDRENDQVRQEELTRLRRTHQLSKDILNYVNDAAKVAHNSHRLEQIQKHLDTSSFERSEQPIAQEFKTIDLNKHKLIMEGSMTLRRPTKALVHVLVLLLEEVVVILHREGDRYLLKFFQSGTTAQPLPLSPIIKMNTLLARPNAACKDSLFVFSNSPNNVQMYDFITDENKRDTWVKLLTEASETYKRREGKQPPSKKGGAGHHDQQTVSDDSDDSASEVAIDLPPQAATERRAAEVGGSAEETKETGEAVAVTDSSVENRRATLAEEESRESTASPEMVSGGGVQTSRVSAEDWPLIQPSQVSVAVPPVHTAESMLTPLEQIRRKDALVKQALEDKEGLVADMLSIPREDFQHIADMASMDNSTSRDPSERVLACIFQGDQLLKAVNQSLNISDTDVLTNKGGKHPSCTSQLVAEETASSSVPLTVPSVVRDIATSLSSQLTTLLSEVKQIEEERDRLRKELHRVKERLHEEHNLHSPVGVEDSENLNSSTSCASDKCTLNDSIQIVNKSDCEEEQ